jgi:hypothetical protein
MPPTATAERRNNGAAQKQAQTGTSTGSSMPAKDEPVSSVKVSTERVHDVVRSPLKYEKISDRRVSLTPQAAEQFLALETFPGERKRSASHAQFLFDEYKAGRFVWDHVILATAKLRDKTYHVNGQHTCLMRVATDEKGNAVIPESTPIEVRRVDYKVSNEDQLRALYGVFDRNVTRTPSQVLKSLLAGRPGMEDVPDATINALGAGLRLWKWGSLPAGFKRTGPFDIANAVLDNHRELFATVAEFFRAHQASFPQVKRASVGGALFATFDKDPKAAQEFWMGVCEGLNLLSLNDPRRKLRERIQNSLQRVERSVPKRGEHIMSAEDVYRACLQCWNKWRRGEQVEQIRPIGYRVELE